MMKDKGISFNVYSLKYLNSNIRLRLKTRFIWPAWLFASGQQFCSIYFAPFHSPSRCRRSFYIITSRYRVIRRDVLLFNGHHRSNRHYGHSALQRHHIFDFTFSFFFFFSLWLLSILFNKLLHTPVCLFACLFCWTHFISLHVSLFCFCHALFSFHIPGSSS